MTVRELIEKLESYAREYGENIPICTFDLDRHIEDVTEVEFCQNHDSKCYIYIGA